MARKKSNNKSEEQEEFDVDEPSEVDESNDADDNEGKETSGSGRRSTRPRKPSSKAMYKTESSSDIEGLDDSEGESEDAEEEDSDEFAAGGAVKKRRGAPPGGGRGRGRGRGAPPAKKKKISNKKEKEDDEDGGENEDDDDDGEMIDEEEEEEESVDEEEEEEDSETDVADTPPEYRSGCFVVLKSDIDNNKGDYPLWKIDGKSLLQKYDRYKNKGKDFFYKSTTIYAGWSKAVVETYYPIKVESVKISGQESAVRFDPTQIKPKEKETK